MMLKLRNWFKREWDKLHDREGHREEYRTIYGYRDRGRDYCKTDGSEHYKGGIEPLDFLVSQDWAEHYCKGNIIKYLARHDRTMDIRDLRKAADYLHILAGVCLAATEAEEEADRGYE